MAAEEYVSVLARRLKREEETVCLFREERLERDACVAPCDERLLLDG